MASKSDSDGLVSVVVPTHYRNDRLREALDSVAAQEYRPIEVVDGSDDEHARPVVAEYEGVEYVHQHDEGPRWGRWPGDRDWRR